MQIKPKLTAGLTVALAAAFFASQAFADGPLGHLFHHRGDCDVKQSVVRLPAQEIRIEAAAPRVVLGSTHTHRMRGYAAPMGMMPVTGGFFAPVATGPFVATVLPMPGSNVSNTQSGSAALDAIFALHAQHLQFAKQQAALQKEVDITNDLAKQAAERLSATLRSSSSGTPDSNDINAQLKAINQRLSDIERLLIIHDNILKENTKK